MDSKLVDCGYVPVEAWKMNIEAGNGWGLSEKASCEVDQRLISTAGGKIFKGG